MIATYQGQSDNNDSASPVLISSVSLSSVIVRIHADLVTSFYVLGSWEQLMLQRDLFVMGQ